ncbi:MAG: hypothetical protein AAB500_02730 [Patescibacteria group bacterium]
MKNPFEERLKALKEAKKEPKKKVNPIHEIVNTYYELRGWDKKPKRFFRKKERSYPKLAYEAKELYEVLNHDLDSCIWALDRMKYLAEKGGFEWSISTCLKHRKL